MTPFTSALIRDNIFYITSENYDSVIPRFYGYAYNGNTLMVRSKPDAIKTDPWDAGFWVEIQDNGQEIIIKQDYFCSFGIYVFKDNDFWAVSNSLYFLADQLCQLHSLTINHDYECLLLRAGQAQSINETIFNEITELLPDEYIIIDRSASKSPLIIGKINRTIYDIDPFSEAGVRLVDAWRERWHTLYSSLIAAGYQFTADITGGMDSRLALVCSHDLDFSQPNAALYCADSFNREDLPIAKDVCRILDLPLSSTLPGKPFIISGEEQLNISLFTKFCMHDQPSAPLKWSPQPTFHSTGAVGKRGEGDESAEDIIAIASRIPALGGIELAAPICNLFSRTFQIIRKNFPEDISDALKLYNYTRIKYHAGRTALEGFMGNAVAVGPFFDPQLYRLALTRKIARDIEIFTAFAITRYLPQLRHLPFDRGRQIEEGTWLQAEALNARYPYTPTIENHPVDLVIGNISAPAASSPENGDSMHSVIAKRYNSRAMRSCIVSRLSREIYDWGNNYNNYNSAFGRINVFGNMAKNRLYMLYEAYLKTGIIFPETANYLPDGIAPDFIKSLNALRINCVPTDNEEGKVEVAGCDDPGFTFFATRWKIPGYGTGIIAHTFRGKAEVRLKMHATRNIRLSMSGTSRVISAFAPRGKPEFTVDFKEISIYSLTSGKTLYTGKAIYGCSFSAPFRVDLKLSELEEIAISVHYEPHSYTLQEFQELVNAAYSL